MAGSNKGRIRAQDAFIKEFIGYRHRQPRASRGERGHPNAKEAFRPRAFGVTAPGVGRVVADKAQTHCPRLEGLVPGV